MDVRCERCRAQYVFDDEQVTPSGLAVQCTNCGHVFKVKKKELVVTVPVKPDEMDRTPLPATDAAPKPGGAAHPPAAPHSDPERPREWRVRQSNGNVFTFRELTTLQKWIVEQKVSRGDEISLSGDQWKRLGNIAELASFFQVVEAAERAKQAGIAPAVTPLPIPVYGMAVQTPGVHPAPSGGYPPPPYAPPPVAPPPPAMPEPQPPPRYAPPRSAPAPSPPVLAQDVDLGLEEEEPAPARRGHGARAALALVLLGISAGSAAYVYVPRALAKRTPPPEELAVPITIEVMPPEPSATLPSLDARPGEPPARSSEPVQAPEASAPPAHAPDDPVAKVAIEAPPAPTEPRALLAQADTLRARGSAKAALGLYGKVLETDPQNVEALTGRGLCYLDLSSYASAEASFQAALDVDPDEPDALLGLAETYRWQDEKADAISWYERYLARHPNGEEAAVARNALEDLRK